MVKAGVKELRDRFTHYLRMVRNGEEIVVTERGKSVAILKPLKQSRSPEEKLASMEAGGLIRLPLKEGPLSMHEKELTPYEVGKGKSLTALVLEEREKSW